MYTVIVTEKGGDQKRLDFDKAEVTIGRVQGNDIVLPKGNVSKRHSRIVFKDGKFIIVDLKSTNGTYVNGRKITSPLVVKDADKVYIGDFIITIEESGVGANVSAPTLAPPPPRENSDAGVEPDDDDDDDADDEVSAPPAPAPARMKAPSTAPPSPLGGMGGPPMPPPLPRKPPGSTVPPPLARVDATTPPAPARRDRATVPPEPPLPPSPLSGALNALNSLDDEDDLENEDSLADDLRPQPVSAPPAARAPLPRPAVKPPAALGGSPVAAPPPPARDLAPPPPRPAPSATGRTSGMRPAIPASEPPAPRAESVGTPRPSLAMPAVPPPRAPMPPPPVAPAPAPTLAAPPPVEVNDPRRSKMLELMGEVHQKIAAQLDVDRIPLERLGDEDLWQRAEAAIVDFVEQLASDGKLPKFIDQDVLIKESLNEVLGLGALEDYLVDEDIATVLVNKPDRVMLERAGQLVPADRGFSSDAALRKVLERLVAPAGMRFDEAHPLIDVRLPDGARLTAAIPPLAVRGACFTLRKLRPSLLALDDLVRAGTLSTPMADFLATCVSARRNIIVCGAPTAGKTALLAALAGLMPASERIVSVEEVAELELARDNWIALETRLSAGEGQPAVGMAEVLRAALRLGPDRLIVGDIRGSEAFELLSTLGSSCDGALVAVGADGARAALARLEALARLGGGESSAPAIKDLVAQACHVIVHVARYGDGLRRVASICEVRGGNEGGSVRELFTFGVEGVGSDGAVRGRFAGAGVVPRFYEDLEARGLPADPSIFR